MQFEWDEHNIAHIARHDVLPYEVEEALTQIPEFLYEEVRNGEPRSVHLGETNAGRVLFIVATSRLEKIRVVTAMAAKRKYREWYAQRKERHNGRKESHS
jgi:uncharacterized DUF497 family protein